MMKTPSIGGASKSFSGFNDTLEVMLKGVVVLLLAFHLCTFLLFSYRLLAYPYDWEPSESDHIYYASRLLRGETLYKGYDAFPLLGIGYPPGYHVLLSLAVKAFGPTMFAGRALALVLAGVLFLFIYETVRKGTQSRFLGVAMGLSLFAYGPVSLWLATVRMETLYVVLAIAGIFLLSRAERGKAYLVAACFCFAYSFFTKQLGLFAMGAAVLFLLAEKRYKECAGLVVLFVILTVPVTLLLNELTDGWYNRHVFGFHLHRELSWGRRLYLLPLIWSSPVLMAAACFEFVGELRERRLSAWTCYLLGSVPVALLIFYDGSAEHYFVPLFTGLLIVAGLGAGRFLLNNGSVTAKAWLYLLLAFQLVSFAQARNFVRGPTEEDKTQLDLLAKVIRSADGPVLVDRMSSLVLGTEQEEYFVEPVLLMYLYFGGEWDPRVMVSAVNERKFSLICMFDKTQFVSPVVDAIRKSYKPSFSIPVRTFEPDMRYSLVVYKPRPR